MIRSMALLVAAAGLAACQTMPSAPSQLPVQVVHGEQLKIWGVDARQDGADITVRGQVQRKGFPRAPLREHVHLEVLDGAGVVVSMEDAEVFPFVALRDWGGTASLSAVTPASALVNDGRLQLRVVSGLPHD